MVGWQHSSSHRLANGDWIFRAAIDHLVKEISHGSDGPETLIEALFQTVTGLGFDGNNNGTFSDSGAAGLVSTQLTPGASGDVPSFASYTVDASGSAVPAAGSLGGAGFRAGALSIILAATDIGLAYQPKGETSILGVGGATLPLSAFTHTSRATTPFNYGAGIQETITGLNALGALVIGLGTNPDLTADPRADLSAIAKLTGAINNSVDTIVNGTATPIAPGDPFYFQISSGFGPSVANGVVSAIQNAVTNIAVNMTVKASDPRFRITNYTGTIANVGAGQTATFDIEFTGDGRPHRFDLQFIREGTNVVLGSIPVVLGTPIPGSGYEFDDLLEGEIELESDFGSRAMAAPPANVAPSFVAGANEIVLEDAGAQTVTAWATSISAGSASESGQTVDFVVSNDNASLFSVAPAISADGTLTYTPAANANGFATIIVNLHDDGGIASGGVDTSASQNFTITVNAVNDAPTASDGSLTTSENSAASGTLSVSDVEGDLQTYRLLSTANAHGLVTLTNAATGAFGYTPDKNFSGSASFTFVANDDTADSNVGTVTITVTSLATRDLVYTATGITPLTVTVVSGKLRVKIGSVVQPEVDPATVRSISLNGGSARDSINLTGLSTVLYWHLNGAMITGGDGNDTLIGGAGADSIDGGNGNDSMNGGAGNDTLFGGAGNDVISGLAGDDDIDAGLGNDTVQGGDGNDDIHGQAGLDKLDGGNGNDCLHGGDDNDKLIGGTGNDTLRGGAGDDNVDAGLGDDMLLGDDGKDTLLGGLGADILSGGLGDDSLNGNGTGTAALDGNDTLLGGAGNDTLKGGLGNDVLSGDDGNDSLTGEAGIDSLFGGLGLDKLLLGETNSQDGVFNDLAFLIQLEELLAACP